MKYLIIPATVLFLVFFLIIPDHSGAAVGDILNTISRSGNGWGGGVTWCNGYIYEVSPATGYARIEKRDPETGAELAEYYTPIKLESDGWLQDIAYDSRRQCFWISVGDAGIYQCSLEGGETWSNFYPFKHVYGLYYEAETDLLWISDNVYARIEKWDLNTFERVERIYLDFKPSGITRIGNYLWICEAGDYDIRDPAVVSQCYLTGERTGVSFELPSTSGYWWDHGGSTFDGTYLWVKGGKYTRIYQIDIGGGTGPPPGPTPTPDNSFEYTIDNLFAANATAGLHSQFDAVINPEGTLRYWCPTAGQEETEGVIVYRFDLPVVIDTISLKASGAVFWGNGELTVEVSPDNRSYHQLYQIPRNSGDVVTNDSYHDATGFLRGSSTVYLRARMRTWSPYCAQFLRGDSGATKLLHLRGTGVVASSRPPVIESGDYDGDGDTDIAVFRESTGLWSVRGVTRLYFGRTGDTPVSGDYNGDGASDIGIFRDSSGLWAVNGVSRVYFGTGGDRPVPGDYDNDGRCDIALFRESSGLWAINGVSRCYFGTGGDIPVPADYNEDGGCEIALFRGGSGLWAIRDHSRIYYGTSGDTPVPARYYPNVNRALCAVFRPGSGLWSIRGVTRFYFGTGSDYPVPGDYARAGHAQAAVFGDGNGRWAIRGVSRVYFGTTGDIPVTR